MLKVVEGYIAKNSLTAALAVTSVVCDGACQ